MSAANLKAFALALRAQWFAAMSGGFSVPFAAAAVFVDSKFGQLIFGALALGAAWLAAYRIWKAERERVLTLEEHLRPKIKLLAVHQSIADYADFRRVAEIEIQNDSGEELSNCLVKVTNISVTCIAGRDGEERREDASAVHGYDLPAALQTARNVARDGGGPFQLRAGETRKISLCSRPDGDRTPLFIHYEPGLRPFMYEIASFLEAELEINIHGAPSPTVERVQMSVDDRGELAVSHTARLSDRNENERAQVSRGGVLSNRSRSVTRNRPFAEHDVVVRPVP
jgi:hypothetical protein